MSKAMEQERVKATYIPGTKQCECPICLKRKSSSKTRILFTSYEPKVCPSCKNIIEPPKVLQTCRRRTKQTITCPKCVKIKIPIKTILDFSMNRPIICPVCLSLIYPPERKMKCLDCGKEIISDGSSRFCNSCNPSYKARSMGGLYQGATL